MNGRFRAPATTANVGPGFDSAAIALSLWNELELQPGDGEVDRGHLGIRAFSLLADPAGFAFRWKTPIPRERGLGSSAAVIALGLVAGAAAADVEPSVDELLALGLPLEGHPDNLAAALAGGVVAVADGRVARLADRAPAEPVALVPHARVRTAQARATLPAEVPLADRAPAEPVALVPHARVRTAQARATLPAEIPLADAAFTAGHAVLLGAALATGSAELFATAAADRLHEPYRARTAPLLDAVRERRPESALAVTLSGSGPTVVVWARPQDVDACVGELEARFPDVDVLPLTTTPSGASAV